MSTGEVLLLAFLLGVVAGLRAMTAPAVVAWAAHRGWLQLHGTALSFMASTAALVIFILLAVGELIGDQLPSTPPRTAPPGLIARIVTGGLCGVCLAMAGGAPRWPLAVWLAWWARWSERMADTKRAPGWCGG